VLVSAALMSSGLSCGYSLIICWVVSPLAIRVRRLDRPVFVCLL